MPHLLLVFEVLTYMVTYIGFVKAVAVVAHHIVSCYVLNYKHISTQLMSNEMPISLFAKNNYWLTAVTVKYYPAV